MTVLDRAAQVAAVSTYLLALLVLGPSCLCLLIYTLLFTPYYPLALLYGVWWLWDVQVCNTGGRKTAWVHWFRSWRLWTHMRDYFPIKLVKTAELDPGRNYILCCHPHGIICFGCSNAFACEANGFSEKFPGIFPHVNTVEGNLWMPGFR